MAARARAFTFILTPSLRGAVPHGPEVDALKFRFEDALPVLRRTPEVLVLWFLLCLVPAAFVMPVLAVSESVAIDRGLLINSVAGYYFRVPEGWTLRDGSDHRKVTVDCGNEASMVISMESELLEPAVASPNAKWVFTEVKLGRRTGRELRLNQETLGMGVIGKRYVTVSDGPVMLTH